jgi:delta-aminolevulinic acid dehydratase/porphobilinogen synthase
MGWPFRNKFEHELGARIAVTGAMFPESLMRFRRAGASGILTYFARDAARLLKSG